MKGHTEGSNEILMENMVITIEPGIYIEGGGYRHSDTIHVTKDGYEVLTTFPTNLVDMTINKSNEVYTEVFEALMLSLA